MPVQDPPPADDPGEIGPEEPAGGVATVDEPQQDGESLAGVLRLLAEGHFKGVADVRLRINFHEEPLAAHLVATRPAVAENVAAFGEEVAAQLRELGAADSLTGEQSAEVAGLQDEFSVSVCTLLDAFVSGGDQDSGTFISAVRFIFDSLVASLQSALEPAPAAAPSDPVEATEPGDADAPAIGEPTADGGQTDDLLSLLDGIVRTGETLFDSLTVTLGVAASLPELLEPTGNGAAYAKFLAIYNELYGLAEAGDTPAQETVDFLT
jgi:hypothetical protein